MTAKRHDFTLAIRVPDHIYYGHGSAFRLLSSLATNYHDSDATARPSATRPSASPHPTADVGEPSKGAFLFFSPLFV